jgi:AcrR family transcriptional regulator
MSTLEITRTPSPRVAQKQARARSRIIEVADELTRNRSVDEVSIKDITETADVGQGTFYIHFKSKNDVLIPIMQADADKLDAAMQFALKDTNDPALIIGTSGRLMGRYVTSNPRWRWVLENSSVPVDDLQRAFGRFGARDYQRGRESGDFLKMDSAIAQSFSFGGLINVFVMSLHLEDPELAIDQAIELSLRALGISAERAKHISTRPLPSIQFQP